jgi:ribonuclease R
MLDPNYDLEAQKYDNPIPSREFIISHISTKKLSYKQLIKLFDLTPEQFKPLKNRLRAMVRDKELSVSKNGVYRLFSNRGLLTGEVIANPKGFGFVKLDKPNKSGKDLRLNSTQMQLCFHGDRVKVRLLGNKLDAEIVEVLTKKQNLVARLEVNNKQILAIIDDKNIKHQVIINKLPKDYENNDVVLLNIVKNPTHQELAQGEIISKLGAFGDMDLEVKSALLRFEIPQSFSQQAQNESAKIKDKVSANDKKNREDLTHLDFVTIDGADSKDFDDAVYAVPNDNGFKLYVAIADVAHYVLPNSNLDKAALERGNSVYFPRFVVPMLPEKLSNNLCSLNEKVLRLSLVCKMQINFLGEVENFSFHNAIIKSKKRLTYDKVNLFLSGKTNLIKNQNIKDNIANLLGVYKLLKINRQKLGLIEFNRKETKISFDDNGKIKSITPYERGVSHKIIEECMLIANKTAGDFLTKHNASFLYRSHPHPSAEKLIATRKFLTNLGLELTGGEKPSAKDFAAVLKQAKGRKDENIIKTIILRTMSQAVYHAEHSHHFGLAFENYTHFTSPIRRYADLVAHRAIKQVIAQKNITKIENLKQMGEHISFTERRADDASRDVERWLKCEYMLDKIGYEFKGSISGVVSFGLFVELADVLVDGLVKVQDMPDYFVYDESSVSLIGKRSGKVYKLGDKIRVTVASVQLEQREINLVLE